MRSQNAGVWAGLIILIFGGLMFVQSLSYQYSSKLGPGPGMFPLWLSGILIVFSFLYIIRSIRKERITFAEILPKGKDSKQLLKVLTALVGFILIVPFIGFIMAGIIFLFILLSGEYRWYINLLISIGVTILLFWVFHGLLSVPLPVNNFGF
ncbi:tripartite tricarboxylate transporter TctB family protein [Fictibacillus sp. FJAT-27399]|uniref:tripartite tricarboxylate transporter TctB family protein n=1 Tax=Fictibacillus sp. FJAT-27399 TaxID=1729689 RepID=UPI000780CB2F|nr:tripartite tricarboxylate transporter TctB family protein [Fictibacillus sp. FJAT-27399]